MSAAARGIVEIDLKSDHFTGPTRQAANEFQQLENHGTRSLKSIEQSSHQTTSDLQAMGNQGTATMDNLSSSAQRLRHSAWWRGCYP